MRFMQSKYAWMMGNPNLCGWLVTMTFEAQNGNWRARTETNFLVSTVRLE